MQGVDSYCDGGNGGVLSLTGESLKDAQDQEQISLVHIFLLSESEQRSKLISFKWRLKPFFLPGFAKYLIWNELEKVQHNSAQEYVPGKRDVNQFPGLIQWIL